MSKKINPKNITLELADTKNQEAVEKAILRAFEHINPDEQTVNIIRVEVGNMPADNLNSILKHIEKIFTSHCLNNCIFIPIHPQGIRSITIESLEVK